MITNLLDVVTIPVDDPVAFTFFTGYMSMFAASVFFFIERGRVPDKWKTSLLVSGLITGIAAVHYYYMRDYYANTGSNPTALRYIDWTLTVPLMCVEFYLLTKPAGATKGLMWRLIIAAVWMLVFGYIGEAFNPEGGSTSHSVLYGVLSTLGYVYILYLAWFGEVKQLAEKTQNPTVIRGIRTLSWFILVGWAIYPIGYMCMPGGWLNLAFGWQPSAVDLFYNIADAINKIGFGLVVYGIAISDLEKVKAQAA
ncbi:bacteriorhodopsin-like [Schleiferia thermophila]|jgi:sensory rhodopsin|uniref:Bacteriorhodopsin n=1 Tax=Schleiferia thermophila TaxID=884107 RepID=A0A369A2B1_9FLAO|nr:bacteriorhodopsin-like [Schleiferia thermophila]KFD39178.1 rhodopsin [Schleiferia thermophila str. Yellowstone]RCX03325.1 bacteriorhodopsin [Schleiferia thermophila]GCD80454.1 xanthorhodopsin [Schleiferia thermophila]